MKNKKILVVEDDNVLRDVLVEKLLISGYEVVGAEDGEIAMQKMRESKPDLVLLDILMPKKDGMEVLVEMSEDENLKNIPVIIISNSGQPVEIERAKKLGAKDFLIKAIFNPNEVLQTVNAILSDDDSGTVEKEKQEVGGDVYIPEKEEENEEANDNEGVSGDNSKKAGSKGKVLVVEDDKFLRELLVRKLFGEGFDIQSAIDSEGAFEILSKWTPEIILLDLILPGEDGFTILEKLKADTKLASIPVIILSNLGQQEDIDKAMSLGASDFMVKANFTLDEIIEKIIKALGK